jgi:Protein of unknown function (DUF3443)
MNQLWIALSAVLVLAGCGGGGGSSSTPAGTSTSTSSTSSSTSSSSNSSSTSSSGSSSTSSGSSTGGASSSSGVGTAVGTNYVPVLVNSGPSTSGTFNIPYASVTVCVPNTTQCVAINNLLVDTGSSGLRIFASVLQSAGISLPAMTDPANASNTIGECQAFVDGYIWGSIATANVKLGGETASNLSVHVIDDKHSYANVPSGCTQLTSSKSLNSVADFFANGVLGVGVDAQDCGDQCASCAVTGTCTPSNDVYYTCSNASGTCTPTPVPMVSQVDNPITFFASDNNGSVLYLEKITSATGGQSTAQGRLTFGINTQSNNALPASAAVLPLNRRGFFHTTLNTTQLPNSFIDSGSNAFFFGYSFPACGTTEPAKSFYCPTSTTQLTAVNQGYAADGTLTGSTGPVTFNIANLNTLTSTVNGYAYNDVGGTAATSTGTNSLGDDFDFGLPFFYGRSVYTAISGASVVRTTGTITGPFVAY